jgi:short-subunit dehydrogenase
MASEKLRRLNLPSVESASFLTYHSNKKGAEDVIRESEQNNAVQAVGLKLDLGKKSTFEDFTQLVKKTLEDIWHRKTFDYLVNNGGIGGGMTFTAVT